MNGAGLILLLAASQATADRWECVWDAIKPLAATSSRAVPELAKKEGAPVRFGRDVLFRFRAPVGAVRAYFAANVNGWANNSAGHVSDSHFAMTPAGDGMWFERVPLSGGSVHYKFVAENASGQQTWLSDPFAVARDTGGNSVLDAGSLPPASEATPMVKWAAPLRPSALPPVERFLALAPQAKKVWVRPGESNTLELDIPAEVAARSRLTLSICTPFGQKIAEGSSGCKTGTNTIIIPPIAESGGYLARVQITRAGRTVASGETVVTVTRDIADDLRYGFFAVYDRLDGDYRAKAAMLASLHINAVEFYDYFPAHGYYAPREPQYTFEPFGKKINARDIQRKIAAGHERNILELGYVAAYAASESVYRRHPDPMTDARGVPKIFNGAIMPEDEADRDHKPKWFWLMDVARGSLWNSYILEEFGHALGKKPAGLVCFDGFEIDTYGDPSDARFYAKGSPRSGDLLRDVLHDFVGDVRSLTHRIKPEGLVSFNSVNEFAADEMSDVTDFLFMEIWRGHTDQLEGLVDTCFDHRARGNKRVVLKVYPDDMGSPHPSWPPFVLRRVLGAAMTGAGTLMVAGEPNEKSAQTRALRSLYYPDSQPMPPENEAILRDYYRDDALLLGYTHGADVFNTNMRPHVKDCIVRTFAAPKRRSLIIQLLQTGSDTSWSSDTPASAPKTNVEITLSLPASVAPTSVWYSTPDDPALRDPVRLNFQMKDGILRTSIPLLSVHATLILRY